VNYFLINLEIWDFFTDFEMSVNLQNVRRGYENECISEVHLVV